MCGFSVFEKENEKANAREQKREKRCAFNVRDTYPKLTEIMLARDSQRSRTDFLSFSYVFSLLADILFLWLLLLNCIGVFFFAFFTRFVRNYCCFRGIWRIFSTSFFFCDHNAIFTLYTCLLCSFMAMTWNNLKILAIYAWRKVGDLSISLRFFFIF